MIYVAAGTDVPRYDNTLGVCYGAKIPMFPRKQTSVPVGHLGCTGEAGGCCCLGAKEPMGSDVLASKAVSIVRHPRHGYADMRLLQELEDLDRWDWIVSGIACLALIGAVILGCIGAALVP